MDDLQAFRMYSAIRVHFNSHDYDYFKYKGSVKNATQSSLDKRNDRYYFHKLSKKSNLELFLASNFYDNVSTWVGDLFSEYADEVYEEDLKVSQSLEYTFTNDMSRYNSLDEALNVDVSKGAGYNRPQILKDFQHEEIKKETIIILDGVLNLFDYWDKSMQEDILYDHIKFKITKFAGFVKYSKHKYNDLLLNIFQ